MLHENDKPRRLHMRILEFFERENNNNAELNNTLNTIWQNAPIYYKNVVLMFKFDHLVVL